MTLRFRNRSRRPESISENPETQTVSSDRPRRSRFVRELGFSDASRLPKRILRWLYSISLIIFMILTFAFILVTPLDIIVQTWGAPSTWLKTFIVIMACALFLFFCLIIYFLRLYQTRVSLNQIPSKSVYIPLEKNDLPSSVRRYIEGTLRRCLGDIKIRAGPLYNKNEIINFPGASPPEYIQKRNITMGFPNEGTHLPPDCSYEEILDTLGMQIKFDGMALTKFDIPECYSFREIALSMAKILIEKGEIDRSRLPEVRLMIKLYEKLKFGPELVKELDLVQFLSLFEKLSLSFHSNRLQIQVDEPQNNTPLQAYKNSVSRSSFGTDTLLSPYYGHGRHYLQGGGRSTRSGTRSELFADIEQDDEDTEEEEIDAYQRLNTSMNELNAQRISRSSTGTSDTGTRWTRKSVSSNASVIKSKLVFRGRKRDRGVHGDEDDTSTESGDAASVRRLNGYGTDSEEGGGTPSI